MSAPDPLLQQLGAAVVAAPGDDTVRLVYADRLDELGGKANAARAKFIRTSIEFHSRYGPLWAGCASPDADRAGWARKLFARHHRDWYRLPTTFPVKVTLGPTLKAGPELALEVWQLWHPFPHFRDQIERPSPWCAWVFERGFLSKVRGHWQHWDAYGSVLTAADPISDVELTTWYGPVHPTHNVPARDAHVVDRIAALKAKYPNVVRWTYPP